MAFSLVRGTVASPDPRGWPLAPAPGSRRRLWPPIFGFVIGSFLNVVVYRVPRGLSVVQPGSFCPSCGTPIRSSDNLPGHLVAGPRGQVPPLRGADLAPVPRCRAAHRSALRGGGVGARGPLGGPGHVRARRHRAGLGRHRARRAGPCRASVSLIGTGLGAARCSAPPRSPTGAGGISAACSSGSARGLRGC